MTLSDEADEQNAAEGGALSLPHAPARSDAMHDGVDSQIQQEQQMDHGSAAVYIPAEVEPVQLLQSQSLEGESQVLHYACRLCAHFAMS